MNTIIENKSFFKNEMLIKHFKKIKENNKALHIIGLLSDAGVHSHIDHLFAFIKLAKQIGVQEVFIHPILDGRDTPPKSAAAYLQQLDNFCTTEKCGKIATLQGRFYAMDRDDNFDRTEKSYRALCFSKFKNNTADIYKNWKIALEESYKNNITDEFFVPSVINQRGTIKKDDGIVFFNFRPDRARQLTERFINSHENTVELAFFVSITRFDEKFKRFNNDVLFEQSPINHTLLDEIDSQKSNPKVFIIAETEKYAHVTYFFRGKRDIQLPNEIRILIPSVKAKNYIEKPEMSAQKITTTLLESLRNDPAYLYIVNYANCDMVGHSGNFEATVKACECLDAQIKALYEEVVEKQNGTLFITADHGNAEEMIDEETGEPKTSHTTNPVPFVVCNKKVRYKSFNNTTKPRLGLASIAPTILKFLGLKIPDVMMETVIYFK